MGTRMNENENENESENERAKGECVGKEMRLGEVGLRRSHGKGGSKGVSVVIEGAGLGMSVLMRLVWLGEEKENRGGG